MVINIAIKGGLGNQLFQYALGCYFKHRYQSPVFYDPLPLSGNEENLTRRPLLLNRLFNDLSFTDAGTHNLFYSRHNALPVKLYKKLVRSIRNYHYIPETDPFQLQLHNATYYLDGYWQHAGIAAYATAHINACTGTFLKSNVYASQIASAGESVAVHVRRGDYVSNAFINSQHGNCDSDYYARAMSAIEQKVRVDGYFVFSDDPVWAKENLRSHLPLTLVEGDTEDPITDLLLMKSCRHQIIANSTFSCWASYLNANPGKQTVAPVNWTRKDQTKHLPLYEPQWLLI